MKTSEAVDQIATALAKAQGAMKNAPLNKVNPHFKSRYADLAVIRDTVVPALSANGIAVTQGTDFDNGALMVVTRLVHTSGQWIESRFPIAIDKPQAMGSAYTYAKRYSLSAICGISADDDDDANAANDGGKVPEAPQKPTPMQAIGGTPGASKSALRDKFNAMVRQIRDTDTIRALDAWFKENAAELDKMPPDWVDEMRIEFVDRKKELMNKVAA